MGNNNKNLHRRMTPIATLVISGDLSLHTSINETLELLNHGPKLLGDRFRPRVFNFTDYFWCHPKFDFT